MATDSTAKESPTKIAREAKEATNLLGKDLALLEKELENAELPRLRDRIVALETTVADLKRYKEESEKRNWQFIFIAVGAGCALVGGIVVQLVSLFLKK